MPTIRVILVVVVTLLAACSADEVADCSTEAVHGVTIAFTDGLNAAQQCEVEVELQAANHSETMDCGPVDGQCFCAGALERSGSYEVTVRRGPAIVDTFEARVTENECHVEPATFERQLG